MKKKKISWQDPYVNLLTKYNLLNVKNWEVSGQSQIIDVFNLKHSLAFITASKVTIDE